MRGGSGKSAGKHRSETSEEMWDFRDLGLQGACGIASLEATLLPKKSLLVQMGSVCVQQQLVSGRKGLVTLWSFRQSPEELGEERTLYIPGTLVTPES